MIIRQLTLCVVLLAHAFAENGALSSRRLSTSDLRTSSAFAGKTAIETSGFDSTYKLSLPKPVQDKNFYLLSLFQRTAAVRGLLSQNKTLKQLVADKASALKKAARCNDVQCFDELMRFEPATIDAVAAELQTLASRPEFKLLAKKDLRPSGVFIRYNDQ